MRIALCTPFKPMDHPRLSGDVTIARDAMGFFQRAGHAVEPVSAPSTALLWMRPGRWAGFARAARAALTAASSCDAWFTYHSYYKAPDVLGPMARRRGLPYFLFAGSHAGKRLWRPGTLPGALLNLRALGAADQVFVNKRDDWLSCAKVVPPERLAYVRPAVHVPAFTRDAAAREALRAEWGVGPGTPVVATAALFRPGSKAENVERVIRACARLQAQGRDLLLVLAGDGPSGPMLRRLGGELLGERAVFAGVVPREELFKVFSAADVFAFPGIHEALGMVYLEAQCCGLPVVATDHRGAPEMVANGRSGLVVPAEGGGMAFTAALGRLLDDAPLRETLARGAAAYVRERHDIDANYQLVEGVMRTAIERARAARAKRGD